MSIFDNILRAFQNRPTGGGGATLAAPRQLPQNVQSIFDILRPPQNATFDVQAASGRKPKGYVPTAINMSNIPVASVFSMPGANPLPQQIFDVQAAQGTKPKGYRPTQIQMNAPQAAGPLAMQQMLALMQTARGATPFAPFGQTGQ
jgi:hypothetical protein